MVRWGRRGEARKGRSGENGVDGDGRRGGAWKASLSAGVVRVRIEKSDQRQRFVKDAEAEGPGLAGAPTKSGS